MWWKRKGRLNTIAAPLAERIRQQLRRWGIRLNVYLQSKTIVFPLRTLKIGLLTTCLLFTIWNVLLIIKGISPSPKDIPTLSMPPTIQGRHAPIVELPRNRKIDTLQFQKYIDSLRSSGTAQKLLDSLRKFRPGLLDSLALVERMYRAKPFPDSTLP